MDLTGKVIAILEARSGQSTAQCSTRYGKSHSYYFFVCFVLDYKNTKKPCQSQNNSEKIARFQTILVISPTKT